jgi:hypothetical protein
MGRRRVLNIILSRRKREDDYGSTVLPYRYFGHGPQAVEMIRLARGQTERSVKVASSPSALTANFVSLSAQISGQVS